MQAKLDERAVAIPVASVPDGPVLEGLYVAARDPARGGVVIAPPHPLFGGSMESPVVSELAWACRMCGLGSLRFNWRGCGASSGVRTSDAAAADADYQAALAQLAGTVSGPLVAAGYSFGAGAALRAAGREPRVGGLVLVAPPPASVDADPLAQLEARVLVLVGCLDQIAPPTEVEPRFALQPRVRLVRVEEADHFFGSGLPAIGAAVREWLSRG